MHSSKGKNVQGRGRVTLEWVATSKWQPPMTTKQIKSSNSTNIRIHTDLQQAVQQAELQEHAPLLLACGTLLAA